VTITLAVPDGKTEQDHLIDAFSAPPGPFLRLLTNFAPVGAASDDAYVRLSVRATGGNAVAIEQFDASESRPIFGFGDGWFEPEYNPRTGLQWRWMSERNEIQLHSPLSPETGGGQVQSPAVPAGSPRSSPALMLHLEGESPLKYFSRPSRLVIRAGGMVLRDEVIGSDFSLATRIPSELVRNRVNTITLETDQTYVPAERSRRTQDRRHLGLRIFKCALRLADPPAS
jgi:hypothetical protein